MTTQKQITLKTGTILPRGLPVRFSEETPTRCFVAGPDREYQVRITSAFPAPDIDDLTECADDSVCESVGGEMVEPDGWDSHGSPSWLLALGLI